MISIRSQILLATLPAVLLIFSAGSFGIHHSTARQLQAQTDTQLSHIAREIKITPRAFGGATPPARRANTQQESEDLFSTLPAHIYAEVWVGNKRIHIQTPNLEDQKIPAPETFTETPQLYTATLQNNQPVRIWAATLNTLKIGPGSELILAVPLTEIHQTLAKLQRNLILGGILSLLILSILLIVILHYALKPLHQLAQQTEAINTNTLTTRFPENKIPADIRAIPNALNQLLERIEESFQRERRFTGNIAHELRTPLAAIRANCEVALKWPDQIETNDLQTIVQQAQHLQALLDRLLMLARIESQAVIPKSEPCHLADLINEILKQHQAQIEKRNLTLQLSPIQKEIQSDPELLHIIFANLISNAIAHAPQNSTITLITQPNVWISCSNHAPELSPADLAQLTDRLWRKDQVRGQSDHSGLGLAIAQNCAKILGAELEFSLSDEHVLTAKLGRPSEGRA